MLNSVHEAGMKYSPQLCESNEADEIGNIANPHPARSYSHCSTQIKITSYFTSLSTSLLIRFFLQFWFHSQVIHNKRIDIRLLFHHLGNRFSSTVTRFAFDTDKSGIGSIVACLEHRGIFE